MRRNGRGQRRDSGAERRAGRRGDRFAAGGRTAISRRSPSAAGRAARRAVLLASLAPLAFEPVVPAVAPSRGRTPAGSPARSLAGSLARSLVPPLAAQESRQPPAVEAGLLLRGMDGVKRVLVVGAHPDDEDTSLLALLALGEGAEAAYFSLTRGEGGQNLIGPELGEGLGIVRTGELLAARALDGGDQFFSRAYDYGYSKSAEEAFRHWPRDSLLADLVWAIRRYRPQVIVSIFGGTPADGHGQHQAAGILAREALEAAADSTRFPEQLALVRPWAPSKLYRRAWLDPERASVALPTGRVDPLIGRSHHQLAMESRSQHRSQDFGTAQSPGPRATELERIGDRTGTPASAPLFAGIDTTLASLLAGLPADRAAAAAKRLSAYRTAVAEAREALRAPEPAAAIPALARALGRLDELLGIADSAGARDGELARALRARRDRGARALLAAARVRIAFRAHDDLLVPGQRTAIDARVWTGGEIGVTASPPELRAPPRWSVRPFPEDAEPPEEDAGIFGLFGPADARAGARGPGATTPLRPDGIALWRFELGVPPDARPTLPYYLEREREGDLYRWPDEPGLRTLPFAPAPLRGIVDLAVDVPGGGTSRVRIEAPVRYRGVDKARGEFWRPVHVTPRLWVTPSPHTLVWPADDTAARSVSITVRSADPRPVSGTLEIDAPAGWRVEPAARALELEGEGSEVRVDVRLRPPPGATGAFALRPRVRTADGDTLARAVSVIDYPHIEPRLHAPEAVVRVERFPVLVARRRIGYAMGSGDEGPDAVRQLGLPVAMIDPDGWSDASLDRFDTIVLGVRAYETRPDLVAANGRLLEWVRRGGTLVVQYNKYEFNDGEFAPYPIRLGPPAPRVTDESAPVRLLRPESPALASPNRIVAADFEGWVQERGLYFPTDWDDRYTALLEMSDEGEPPRRGSLLVARHGEGLYVHTSLSFFRQLPAGVPGAYRLLANLLSLDGAAWPEDR